MKRIILLLCAVTILSCNKESKEYALISGKIENAKTLYFHNSSNKFEIKVKEDGTFLDTVRIEKSSFYKLSISENPDAGVQPIDVYIQKTKDLQINGKAKSPESEVRFEGEGASENNYLQAKMSVDTHSQQGAKEIYSLNETDFKNKLNEIETTNLKTLEKIENADENFLKFEKQNIKYDKIGVYRDYQRAHSYFTKNKEFKISESFLPKELNQPFENSELYEMSSSYKDLALNSTIDTFFSNLESASNTKPKDLNFIQEIKVPALKNDMIKFVGTMLLSPSSKHLDDLYVFFNNNITDPEVKIIINEAYESNKKLLAGMPSPKFLNYENNAGGTTSLDDLKGKYVYIDVWATWCGPCIAEIPELKEIEKKYHSKNIEFVSASIDTPDAYDKWKKMIKAKELGGIQLLADKAWQSQFVKDYAISGIPRFILIDPNGNIVSADAPRPSNLDLTTLLDAELSK